MSLTVQVRSKVPTATISLIGRLVLGQDFSVFRPNVLAAIEHGAKEVVINLAGVTYIDSSGLGELAMNHATVAKAGSQMVLLNALDAVRAALEITRLDIVIPVSQTAGVRDTGSNLIQ